MSFFRRNSRSQANSRRLSSKQCSTSTLGGVSSSIRIRNAFMHFLSAYRKEHNIESHHPVWCVVIRAADLWNKMSLNEKFPYIEAARNTSYMYTSRDRRLNRVMRYLRKSLHSKYNVDVHHLSKAVKQVLLWKRRLLHDILYI